MSSPAWAAEPEPTGGVIESGETATPTPEPTELPEPTEVPAPTEEPVPTEQPTEAPVPSEEPEPTEAPEPTAVPEPTEAPAPAEDEYDFPTYVPSESFAALNGWLDFTKRAVASNFRPGNIISDFNFYNGSAMTEAEIQRFLEVQGASCNGPLCLKNLRVDTPTRTWSFGTCSTYQGAAGESAARIIYKVQRACNLSAKVILVTLQKEQTLITRSSVSESDLRKAMGYGCPDTSVCDSTYYGFFNQIFAAGRQLTWYSNPGGSFTSIKIGQSNPIRFSPDASCGSSNVVVENRATAALYYYTPYQPNASALANLYGTGDRCGAYGNRNFWVFYTDWFGDPRLTTFLPIERLSGDSRYETAAAISRATYGASGIPVVYIASGGDFPDALSAAPAAVKQGGPLLLVNPGGTPSATIAELARLKPKRIVIVGGTGAVSETVANQVASYAPVTRIAGEDRYETSRKVVEYAFPSVSSAYIATGADFPDALSAGAAAGSKGVPVLLVPGTGNSLDPQTTKALTDRGIRSAKIAGGAGVVTTGVEQALTNAGIGTARLSGADRYLTSVAINKDAFGNVGTAYVATGMDYPDALAGAAGAGKSKAPLYLSWPSCMTSQVRGDITSSNVKTLRLLGGSAVLNDRVAFTTVC
ncbi:cell wall-binding repeat-containing protein [Agromyces atrinae]|uniref:Putative cell wall-binding protein n=1 Tax=Agromyces atrinae TaxID=592376 RepID=A0A4Q2ME56_9MICO|nr:cell wall-binding repeat-containing protein [Agromyces atrinae]NYD66707.1 putative cell wall-binding protein [Agromyces atrinae]RXZ87370.1 hypothetical protein ESP50_05470 [Agromyces atrinae]